MQRLQRFLAKGKGCPPRMPSLSRRRLLFFLPMAEKVCCRETDIGMNHCISGHAKNFPKSKSGRARDRFRQGLEGFAGSFRMF